MNQESSLPTKISSLLKARIWILASLHPPQWSTQWAYNKCLVIDLYRQLWFTSIISTWQVRNMILFAYVHIQTSNHEMCVYIYVTLDKQVPKETLMVTFFPPNCPQVWFNPPIVPASCKYNLYYFLTKSFATKIISNLKKPLLKKFSKEAEQDERVYHR